MAGARTTKPRTRKLTFTRGIAQKDRESGVMWIEVINENGLGRGDIINLAVNDKPFEMVYLGVCSNGRKYLREIVEVEQEYSIAA